jgi:prevent-host-death family protein
MQPVTIDEAETRLPELIERAEHGEEVVIARAGKPVVRLVPVAGKKPRRRLGSMRGQFEVPDDFNDPLPDDVLDLFEGKG